MITEVVRWVRRNWPRLTVRKRVFACSGILVLLAFTTLWSLPQFVAIYKVVQEWFTGGSTKHPVVLENPPQNPPQAPEFLNLGDGSSIRLRGGDRHELRLKAQHDGTIAVYARDADSMERAWYLQGSAKPVRKDDVVSVEAVFGAPGVKYEVTALCSWGQAGDWPCPGNLQQKVTNLPTEDNKHCRIYGSETTHRVNVERVLGSAQ